jgi:cleavage stimulation factor subunit 3
MAEEDAEQAFFQAQAISNEYDPAGVAQNVEVSDSEEDYDPSNTLHDEYSVTVAEPNPNDTIAESNDASSATQSIPQDSYQPDHVDTAQTSQPPSRPDSQTSVLEHVQPKTKTIGGFVVDDDEDEEEDEGEDEDKDEAEYEPPGVLETIEHGGHISAGASEQLPFSEKNANETISTSGVSIQPLVPETASSKDVSNNPVSFHSGHNLYTEVMQQAGDNTDSNAPTPIPLAANTAASRNRLPHDRIGLLEDRIKEDPRGDINAWIELLAEHRSRNRLDNAREVYERFFKVFPSSVRRYHPPYENEWLTDTS